jgi:hypothetical protein
MEVVFKALQDEAFFKALLKDVDRALVEYGISLTPEDTDKLKSTLDSPSIGVEFDLRTFLHAAHTHGLEGLRWIGFTWVGPFRPRR